MNKAIKTIFNTGIFCFLFVMSGFGQYQSLSVSDFQKKIKKRNIQIIDVRSLNEYQTEHIKKAINIDVSQTNFEEEICKLNKKKGVAVYCKSGKRSKIAAQKLSALGFKVYELDKGIIEWKKEGLSVIK